MPAEQGGWLHNDEGLSPVEPTAEPSQGETGGIGGTPRRNVALYQERQLFAKKEVLRRERSRGAQTEAQVDGTLSRGVRGEFLRTTGYRQTVLCLSPRWDVRPVG